MKEYTIEDAIEIIKNCDKTQISVTRHFHIRNEKRNDDLSLVYETFLTNEIKGILKQDFNKFKVIFEHKTKPSEDMNIIFIILEDNTLRFITTFNSPKKQRVK